MKDAPVASRDTPGGSVAHLRALGTTVTLAVDRADAMDAAQAELRGELDAVDRACSRFREDSEIHGLYVGGGRPVEVGALLFEAVSVACAVAQRTGGAVDPTVGRAVEALGYDRDFAQVALRGAGVPDQPVPAPGWWCIDLDDEATSIAVPPGVHLDLGATAKALVADRAARAIASDTCAGVLVCIGGDVAVAGPAPDGGWPIGIALNSALPMEDGPVVSIMAGGLASSSTAVRAWHRGSRRVHHIVDPVTGDCASAHWRLVTAVGASCVDANAWSTAAVIWGEDAPDRLEHQGVPARFVRHDGVVVTVARWPADASTGNREAAMASGVRA
jgi:thiamine biosynthesis lipoprotein